MWIVNINLEYCPQYKVKMTKHIELYIYHYASDPWLLGIFNALR